MSHTTKISSVQIRSTGAIEAAVAELKAAGVDIQLVPNAKPRAYYEEQQGMGVADFILKLGGCKYDVGLYKQEDGSYEIRADFWQDHIGSVLGAPGSNQSQRHANPALALGRFTQTYAIHATMESARRKGLSVQRTTRADGKVALTLTGASL